MDQAKAVQFEQLLIEQEVERCSRCGTHPDDWIDPDTGKRWARPKWRTQATICRGCAAVHEAESEATASWTKEDRDSLRIQLVAATDEDDEEPQEPDLHPD
jgi:hypothetical protein